MHRSEGAGGTTITSYTCIFCGDDYVSGTTAHPDLCPSCVRLVARVDAAGLGDNEVVTDIIYFLATKVKAYRERLNSDIYREYTG